MSGEKVLGLIAAWALVGICTALTYWAADAQCRRTFAAGLCLTGFTGLIAFYFTVLIWRA